MSRKKTNLNRGQILAAVVEASRLNKEEVAQRAGYSRSGYYKHIANPELDFHILTAYGRAIRYDFTEEFPDMPRYIFLENEESYDSPVSLEEALRQKEGWRRKYIDLLEKYNRLIEEKLAQGRKPT